MIATFLFAVVLLAVVLALQAWWAISRPRLASDPGFEVAALAGREGQGRPLAVHVLGDSTIAGVGVEREADALAVQLAERAAAALGQPIRVTGHGVTGARTDDVLDQLEGVPADVDAIVIEVGSNDVTHLTPLDEVEESTRRMLEAARRRSPVVVLGSAGKLDAPIFLQPLRALVMARATAVRRRQRRVARALDVPFVDVAREVSPTFDRIGPEAYSSDRFHPSARGYAAWAAPLAAKLVAELRGTAATTSGRPPRAALR